MSKSLRPQRLQRLQRLHRRIDLKWYENSPFEMNETDNDGEMVNRNLILVSETSIYRIYSVDVLISVGNLVSKYN